LTRSQLLIALLAAPQPAEHTSTAPEPLAHQFIVAAVVTSLLFGLVLGSLTGFLYKRIAAA
jgi:predicted cobalt transporter CbtA